jgi:hypothetical protein
MNSVHSAVLALLLLQLVATKIALRRQLYDKGFDTTESLDEKDGWNELITKKMDYLTAAYRFQRSKFRDYDLRQTSLKKIDSIWKNQKYSQETRFFTVIDTMKKSLKDQQAVKEKAKKIKAMIKKPLLAYEKFFKKISAFRILASESQDESAIGTAFKKWYK